MANRYGPGGVDDMLGPNIFQPPGASRPVSASGRRTSLT